LLTSSLPAPTTYLLNEPNMANLLGWGWYLTTHLCGRVVGGEVDVFNIIFCNKNVDYKTNTHLFTPQDATATYTYSNYSKARRSRRTAKHWEKASNGFRQHRKSWFRSRVENGLQRGKPWWLPMVGGHRSVAKGVGERAKQREGLYLGCQLRYSRQ
jgi:hypothetical protein